MTKVFAVRIGEKYGKYVEDYLNSKIPGITWIRDEQNDMKLQWNKLRFMDMDIDEPIVVIDIDMLFINDYMEAIEYPIKRGEFLTFKSWWGDTGTLGYSLNGGFQKYYPKLDQKYTFRIICPNEEINKITKEEIDFFKKLNIQLKPYLVEPYSYYSESRALIVPSTYGEGLSRVVLEASYFGIPILASKINGIEEILPKDYKYFIKSNNPFCIAQQLSIMLKDLNYFKRINAKQKIYIKKHYSINNSINTFNEGLFDN